MKLAMRMNPLTEENLQFARQIGVTHLVLDVPTYLAADDGPYYDYARIVQARSRVEAAGLEVAAVQNVPATWYDRIRYGAPGRDEQIDYYCRTLTNLARAGIPALGYNFHAVRVWRTSRHTRGRGGALFTSYDHRLMERAPLAGPREIGEDELWENYSYFVTRAVPVAESEGIEMALHPDDPPLSPIAGAACLFRDVESFRRALAIAPSPRHRLLFCQGCFAEMLGQGVYDAIREFAGQDRVSYVHFRNVVGTVPAFREAFLDEGDIDMLRAARTWTEVGFRGALMPDHHPRIVGDSEYGHRARALAIGYMKALFAAAEAMGPMPGGGAV